MGNKNVIPFYCEECGVEFNLLHGGICHYCGKVFCRKHMEASNVKENRLTMFKRFLKYVRQESAEDSIYKGHVCTAINEESGQETKKQDTVRTHRLVRA